MTAIAAVKGEPDRCWPLTLTVMPAPRAGLNASVNGVAFDVTVMTFAG